MAVIEGSDAVNQVPMHKRRPEWLQRRITEHYKDLVMDVQPPYSVNGEHPDYLFRGPLRAENDMWASRLVMKLEAQHARALRILDIGAGAGTFVLSCLNRGHEVLGLSAHDYRVFPRYDDTTIQLPEGVYVVDDAHNLNDTPELGDSFDLIVSHHAFMHLEDPLSVLEQAVNKLRPNGIFVTDQLDHGTAYKSGVNSQLVIDALNHAGLATEGSHYTPYCLEFNVLFAYAGDETATLILPVDYIDYRPMSV